MISLILASLLQTTPQTTSPVAPGAFDFGLCVSALVVRAEGKGYNDDHLEAMMNYYLATREFHLEEASARFALFANSARLTDAHVDALTLQIENEPAKKTLFAEQMAIANKLKESFDRIDKGSAIERCDAVSEFSSLGLAAAKNAKAQSKYIQDWTSKKAQEMGIALAQ